MTKKYTVYEQKAFTYEIAFDIMNLFRFNECFRILGGKKYG